MWERIKQLLAPPVFEGDQEKTNSARLLNTLLLVVIAAAAVFSVAIFIDSEFDVTATVFQLAAAFTLVAIALFVVLRFGYVQAISIVLSFTWWAAFTYGMYRFGGLHDTAITGLFFMIILSSVIAGRQALFIFSAMAAASMVGIYYAEHRGLITPTVSIPSDIADLILPIVLIVASTFILRTTLNFLNSAYADIRTSASSLAKSNLELQDSQAELQDRTQELERRTVYLEATGAVARDIASELDPETLLRRVVILVSEQFDFYHTGLFLIDPTREYAVLRAASSAGGQKMLARGHRLRVGQEGIVGYVTDHGTSRVAMDTGADAVFFDNPDLPDTRSEVALPLRVRGQVIGALDVQSTESEAFDEEDISVLQTMADQIASALQTAQLFSQVEESLDAQQRAYGEISQRGWQELLTKQENTGVQYVKGAVVQLDEYQLPEDHNLPEITLPITIAGRTVAQITAHKPSEDTEWSPDELAIMDSLAGQLGIALESARLYQETQQRAAREQLTSEITARVRETLDIATIMRTATEEIRGALNLPEVVIRLGEPEDKTIQGVSE